MQEPALRFQLGRRSVCCSRRGSSVKAPADFIFHQQRERSGRACFAKQGDRFAQEPQQAAFGEGGFPQGARVTHCSTLSSLEPASPLQPSQIHCGCRVASACLERAWGRPRWLKERQGSCYAFGQGSRRGFQQNLGTSESFREVPRTLTHSSRLPGIIIQFHLSKNFHTL